MCVNKICQNIELFVALKALKSFYLIAITKKKYRRNERVTSDFLYFTDFTAGKFHVRP